MVLLFLNKVGCLFPNYLFIYFYNMETWNIHAYMLLRITISIIQFKNIQRKNQVIPLLKTEKYNNKIYKII